VSPVLTRRWLLLAALATSACKRSGHHPEALLNEKDAPLLSVVKVNDPAASAQLIRGFYAPEGAWSWTMKKFEVALKPPAGAATKGATLTLKLNIPDPIISKLGPVTLSASVNGLALPPETYSKPGEYVYTRDVSTAALQGDVVAVEFTSDKAIPPTPDDPRELALIVVSAGLEPK
jgi:hypothetical protein